MSQRRWKPARSMSIRSGQTPAAGSWPPIFYDVFQPSDTRPKVQFGKISFNATAVRSTLRSGWRPLFEGGITDVCEKRDARARWCSLSVKPLTRTRGEKVAVVEQSQVRHESGAARE
jgi:hypothetical protein